jgi:hypothetical protein
MSAEIEVQAKELGWSPKEEFRGDPEKWVDAETFVKRGEELIPLLKAQTKKDREAIKTMQGQLRETQSLLKAATESIEALKETTSKDALDKVREKKGQLKEALAAARTEGDIDKEVEIQERLAETTAAIKASETAATTTKVSKTASGADEGPDPTKEPDWQDWVTENEWFGIDKRKTGLALGIAQDLRAKGDNATGKKFFDKVTQELNSMLGVKPTVMRDAPSKVEGDARGSAAGGGEGGTKSYNDLPAEAKAACESAAGRVVGKGRAYADLASWRKAYVVKYYE